MADRALTRLPAHRMAARLRAGDLSAVELLEAHLACIEERSPPCTPGSRWTRTRRGMRRSAADDAPRPRARREGRGALAALPPLLGIPVALKDLVVQAGRPATAGSRILEGFIAPYDAHIAERLDAAGAVVVGKTNMDEFAMGSSTEHSAFGPTANPWDLPRVPGGSSGGSAVAVAAFHVPLAIGTDTGGSIRQPAAMTGTVGVKPTYGRVSRYGIVAFASSLDQVGPVRRATCATRPCSWARSPATTPATRPRRRATSPTTRRLPSGDDEAAGALRGMRLGLPRQYFVEGMEPGVEARVREAVAALAAAGAEIVDIDLPHTDYGLATYYIIAPAEASANLARYDGIRYGHLGARAATSSPTTSRRATQGFGAEVKRRIMLGHLRALGGLLRRVLREGAEGAHAHQGRLRPRVRDRRRDRRADEPDRRLPARREAGRPRRDVPRGRLHVARQRGRAAGDVRSRAGSRTGCRSGLQLIGSAWDEPRLSRLARAYEAVTATADWRRWSRATLRGPRSLARRLPRCRRGKRPNRTRVPGRHALEDRADVRARTRLSQLVRGVALAS